MLRYYQDEMRYLHEAGKAFAELHPEEAGQPGLTDAPL